MFIDQYFVKKIDILEILDCKKQVRSIRIFFLNLNDRLNRSGKVGGLWKFLSKLQHFKQRVNQSSHMWDAKGILKYVEKKIK